MKVNFDDLMPVERRFILVASDEKYKSLTDAIPMKRLLMLLPAILLPYRFLLPLLTIGADELKKLLRRGEIPIPHMSPREADSRFRFDHHHPIDGAAYVSHPVLTNHYLAPAIANERLAQEKFAAFLDLTAALGARKLEIISGEFLDKKKAGKFNITSEAARFGIEFLHNSKSSSSRNVVRQFQKPNEFPHVPKHVTKWLEEDPIFRSLAYARLEAKALTDQAQLRIENRISIDSSITGGLEGKEIDAGGESREVISSVFGFSVEYWPIDDQEPGPSK